MRAMDWWFWMGIAFIVIVLLLLIIKTLLVFPGLLNIHRRKSYTDTELGCSTVKDPMSRRNRRRSTINKSIQCSFPDPSGIEESSEHLLEHKMTDANQDNISSQRCIGCQMSRDNSVVFPMSRNDSACFSVISRNNSVCFSTSTPPSGFSASHPSCSPIIHSAPASYTTSHTSREDVTKMVVREDVTHKDKEVQLKLLPVEDGCVIIFKTHKQAEQEVEH